MLYKDGWIPDTFSEREVGLFLSSMSITKGARIVNSKAKGKQ